MIKIVYANTIDYGFSLQQRPHHIMNALAQRGFEVHWINSTQEKGVRPDRYHNLTVWHDWDTFIKRNPECDIYFSSWSARYVDLDKIKAKKVIYDSLDNFEANEPDELKMIERADLVLTTSQPLFELRSTQHPNVKMCRNGCWSGFVSRIDEEKPKDIEGDYLLFSGAVSDWVDTEILNKLTAKYQVVIAGIKIGKGDVNDKVKTIGGKSYVNLQTYYKNALVNLVPFKRCQTSDYSNPIKMYEAAVFGVPTVSTDIPEAVIHSDVIYVASTHNDFIQQVDKAVKQRKDKQRFINSLAFAEENDWGLRVDLIESEIKGMLI